MISYAKIIHEAWEFTAANPKLKWFAFFPSFAAVVIFSVQVTSQLYFFWSQGHESSGIWDSLINLLSLFSQNNLWGWIFFAATFFVLFGFILPSWVLGAIILSIRQKITEPEKRLSLRKKFVDSYGFFFRMMEFNGLASLFSMWSILLFSITFYRYFGDFFTFVWPVFAVYGLFALVLTVLTSYTPFYIVLEDQKFVPAVKNSIALTFVNLGKTLGIILLMFLVNFRVIINALVAIGVPLILASLVGSISSTALMVVAVIMGGLLIGLTAYLTAIIEVFSQAVWVRFFLILEERYRQEKL